jgi:hypothetical protein
MGLVIATQSPLDFVDDKNTVLSVTQNTATKLLEDPNADEPSGRFWNEWVVANKNKPSEQASKQHIYRNHLKGRFAKTSLDEIDAEAIAQFRASLAATKLSEKRINNVLAVLSKSLRWAEESGVISRAPRIRFYIKSSGPSTREFWVQRRRPELVGTRRFVLHSRRSDCSSVVRMANR